MPHLTERAKQCWFHRVQLCTFLICFVFIIFCFNLCDGYTINDRRLPPCTLCETDSNSATSLNEQKEALKVECKIWIKIYKCWDLGDSSKFYIQICTKIGCISTLLFSFNEKSVISPFIICYTMHLSETTCCSDPCLGPNQDAGQRKNWCWWWSCSSGVAAVIPPSWPLPAPTTPSRLPVRSSKMAACSKMSEREKEGDAHYCKLRHARLSCSSPRTPTQTKIIVFCWYCSADCVQDKWIKNTLTDAILKLKQSLFILYQNFVF